jgi:hypothetical protein
MDGVRDTYIGVMAFNHPGQPRWIQERVVLDTSQQQVDDSCAIHRSINCKHRDLKQKPLGRKLTIAYEWDHHHNNLSGHRLSRVRSSSRHGTHCSQPPFQFEIIRVTKGREREVIFGV